MSSINILILLHLVHLSCSFYIPPQFRLSVRKGLTIRLESDSNNNESELNRQPLVFGKGDILVDKKRARLSLQRFVLFNTLGLFIALGGNLFGVTSLLMSSTAPTLFQSAKLDQIYPIQGYKRYVSQENQYEFKFPQNWLPDQLVIFAKAKEREVPDRIREGRSQRIIPDIAYGPPGDTTENLSVIKSAVMPGFTLRGTLGTPAEGAQFLLSNIIAPLSSGKSHELLSAFEDFRNGNPAYTFEYTIKKGDDFFIHSVSVIISRGTELYTFTIVTPEQKWRQDEYTRAVVSTVSKSFQFINQAPPEFFY